MKATPTHLVLTPRERDLVRGITSGWTNREIARAFGLSEQAVKNVCRPSITNATCGTGSNLRCSRQSTG
jgi:DNA-binding NarL/FixJ family response regulator